MTVRDSLYYSLLVCTYVTVNVCIVLNLHHLRFVRLDNKPEEGEGQTQQSSGRSRPLYEVPYLFEAREFLRKRLIGRKVNVTVDYVKPAQDGFPERIFCTVTRESM